MTQNTNPLGISVIICTYNGEKKLPSCLDALKMQIKVEEINWELIVVDNASKDNTQQVVRENWDNSKAPLNLIYEPKPGRNNALKNAFENVKYEYVINVDDDNLLCEDYLFNAYRIMNENTNVGILGGRGFGKFTNPLPEWIKPFTFSLAIGAQAKQDGVLKRNYLYGAGLVYRKAYYNQLFDNGFSFFLAGRKGKKLLAGEDMEICMAMKLAGYDLYYSSVLTFEHVIDDNRINKEYILKLYKGFGASDLILDLYKYKLDAVNPARKKAISKGYIFYMFYCYFKYLQWFVKYMIKPDKSRTKLFYNIELLRSGSHAKTVLFGRKQFNLVRSTLDKAEWIKTL